MTFREQSRAIGVGRPRAPLAVVTVALVACLAVACESGRKRGKKHTDDHTKTVVNVQVEPVSKRTFARTLELDGSFEPAERILVAPSIPGVIRKITKRAGDKVKKGELLVEVDPKEIYVGTIQLRMARASARAKATAAATIVKKLREPLARLRRLYEAKAISRSDLDKVEIPYVQAKAELDAARSVIKRSGSELGIAYSKISDTKIRAPFDGYVVRRLVDPGETARPFPPTVVMVLTKHDPLYVQTELNEDDVTRVSKGQAVTVRCGALGSAPPIKGVLEEIIPYVNPMTRTVTIRVRVDNPKGTLMPGMSATVRIPLRPIRALAVDRRALATAPLENKVSVFVVGKDNRAVERTLRFGRSQGKWIRVLGGLSDGDRVVVKGHEKLFDKSPLRITAEAPRADAASPARRPAPRKGAGK